MSYEKKNLKQGWIFSGIGNSPMPVADLELVNSLSRWHSCFSVAAPIFYLASASLPDFSYHLTIQFELEDILNRYFYVFFWSM